MNTEFRNFPAQQLPYSKKGKEWRRACMDWADSKSFFNYSVVRKSVIHKKINYDLLNGKLHMEDLGLILNPEELQADYIPNKIQHYPIINTKLDVLRGEEAKRVFDYKVVVTNPNAISEIENDKKEEILQKLQEWITNTSQSEEEAQKALEKLNDYYTYEWQDFREERANTLLNHYVKEQNFPLIFNYGFQDALAVAEEIYQARIVHGEPVLERINPLKIRVFKSGYSNKIEDADMIILEDYWSPGKIIDTYGEYLTKADFDYLEKTPDHVSQGTVDDMGNIDERYGFINKNMISDVAGSEGFWDPFGGYDGVDSSLLPYDTAGNIRVLRLYWKSKRKIKKVKSYDPDTGEAVYNFYPENYVCDKDKGEEETSFYINQAWEGTKIGEQIYVNIRPCEVQYNRLSNPSACHFGIIGSIYNLNDARPYSMVDRMKHYNYLYDVIHDRLNKLLAKSWGSILRIDFAKKPKGWNIEQWIHYMKTMGIFVEDSFNEGTAGAAMGKLAGGLNNASTGVVNTNDGNVIQQYVNLLEFIKMEMSDAVGISKQREGAISNRETVGGVERSVMQSSHITEWIFTVHEDVKKRALECFLETAKMALRGRNKKFQYILSDNSLKVMDIDGDEFAECDYGLVVDNSNGTQELNNKLDTLAQAALQNQALNFSTIMKLYTSCSLAEKQRMVERNEQKMQEAKEQQQQQEMQMAQQQQQTVLQQVQMQMQQQDLLNQRDNETRIKVAEINAVAEAQRFAMMNDENLQYTAKDKAQLLEDMRQFDAQIALDRDRLALEREKVRLDNQQAVEENKIKARQISKQAVSTSKNKK